MAVFAKCAEEMVGYSGVDLVVHEGAGPLLVAEGELKREGNGKNTTYYRLK